MILQVSKIPSTPSTPGPVEFIKGIKPQPDPLFEPNRGLYGND